MTDMLTRRRVVLALGALPVHLPAIAQGLKLRRIAFLSNDPTRASIVFQAFLGGLRELGWIEGKNIEIIFRSSEGKDERYRDIATEVVRQNVEVIVTSGSPPTAAAKAATNTIPIVFGSAANPVEQKFVASLANPGGNITGLALLVQELGAKRWEILKALLPRATRFARLYDASSISTVQPSIIEGDDAAARKLRVTLRHLPVAQVEGIEPTLSAAARSGIEGVHVTAASVFVVNRALVAKIALQHKIPVLGPDGRFADVGVLASYGENFAARYRRAAFLVDKILRGTKPADIPVERPTEFELVINLRTASALGVKVPEEVRLQASRVIK